MGAGSSIPMTAGAGLVLLTVGVLADCLGGSGAGTTLATLAIKGLAIGAGGAAGNAVWDTLKQGASQVHERLRNPNDRLSNHDLHALAGRAIAVVSAAAARDCPGGSRGRQYLERIAKRFPANWSTATLDPRYDQLLDKELPKFFGKADGTQPKAAALTVALWENLIGSLAGVEVDDDQRAALQHVAQRLHVQFPRALFELAKEDFAPEVTGSPHQGKAFAALLLTLVRDTMGGIGELLRTQEAAIGNDKAIIDELKRLNQSLATRGESVARLSAPDINAIVQPIATEIAELNSSLADWLEKLFNRISQVQATADEINERTQRIEAEVEKLAKGGRPATATPTNLPDPSPRFTSRAGPIARLHDLLEASGMAGLGQAAAVWADGGVGKSMLAEHYGWLHIEDYPTGVFKINADAESLVTALAALAPLLGVATMLAGSPPTPRPDAEVAADVRACLQRGKSLLILDNVPSAELWADGSYTACLPSLPCRRLLTTRAEYLDGVEMQRLDEFTPEEGAAVLARHRADAADPANIGFARAISAWFGGLGAGLLVVGVYMALNKHLSWRAYAEQLGARGLSTARATHQEVVSKITYKQRFDTAFDTAIASLTPLERTALDVAALLPEDMVPLEWLHTLLADDPRQPESPPKPGYDSHAAWAVSHLRGLGLLRDTETHSELLALHRVLRETTLERLAADAARETRLLRAIAACAFVRTMAVVKGDDGEGEGDINNPAVLTEAGGRWELTPLAAVCAALWQRGLPGPAARVGVWLAGVLQDLGRLPEAAACLSPVRDHEAAVEAALGAGGLASCYSNLALIQRAQGDLPGARASMERAIAIESKHFAPDHPTFATSYSNLALIQRAQGDLPGARASMERAIEIDSKHFAPDHPTFATRYSNLAMIQKDQGDLPGARASMERAIEIGIKHFGPEHPLLATYSSNLALIQQAQGDLSGARASMERAIAIAEKHFAPDHPTFATSYSNLAGIQKDQGDLPGARASMERAIAIAEKHFAPDHPTFATSYSNLAGIQKDQGDLPGARASMEKAIAIDSKHFAPDHPNLAIRYNNLAHICVAEGKIPEAVALWRKSYAIRLKALGPDHPHTRGVAAALRHFDPPGP
ncbi:MAG: tetratricopeptide repeat protein [Phycisphaerales bacterium]|nr:tetratricopeptide repeat protein [Phycisphaerales bacterium]